MITYSTFSSEFHGGHHVGGWASLAEALTQLGCGSECACPGGDIRVDGRPLVLHWLPDAVLSGEREPTLAEVISALEPLPELEDE